MWLLGEEILVLHHLPSGELIEIYPFPSSLAAGYSFVDLEFFERIDARWWALKIQQKLKL